MWRRDSNSGLYSQHCGDYITSIFSCSFCYVQCLRMMLRVIPNEKAKELGDADTSPRRKRTSYSERLYKSLGKEVSHNCYKRIEEAALGPVKLALIADTGISGLYFERTEESTFD
ncbi:hypothetical protein M0R45_024451 [Rubus argutus]|uniref:Uncharacterized protein n=1 Tax=Rubus argutus TaxID=59490 RepID=A0AAW1WT50_RUBAR